MTRQPEPPRDVALWPLIQLEYRRDEARYLLVIGLLAAGGLVAFSLAPGDAAWRIFGQVVTGGLLAWSLARPIWAALRMRQYVQAAWTGTAVVREVQYRPPADAGDSVDALRNGLAEGRWRVDVGNGNSFDATFATDAPWASQLREGSVVDVIVSRGDWVWGVGLTQASTSID